MTIKELREYRLICSELEQIECHLNSSKSEKSKDELRKKKSMLKAEKLRLEMFLDRISDRRIYRAIFIYCFENIGIEMKVPTWENVADKMGDGSSGDSVRKAVERYMKENIFS